MVGEARRVGSRKQDWEIGYESGMIGEALLGVAGLAKDDQEQRDLFIRILFKLRLSQFDEPSADNYDCRIHVSIVVAANKRKAFRVMTWRVQKLLRLLRAERSLVILQNQRCFIFSATGCSHQGRDKESKT